MRLRRQIWETAVQVRAEPEPWGEFILFYFKLLFIFLFIYYIYKQNRYTLYKHTQTYINAFKQV